TKINIVQEILKKYDLFFAVIGEVSENSHYIAYYKGEKVLDLPASLIVEGFPEPKRNVKVPSYINRDFKKIPKIIDFHGEIVKLFSSPNIGDKSWVYEQYDQHVQTQTIYSAGKDAAVLRLDNKKHIAVSIDSNSFAVFLDPYNGTANTAAEAMRNLVSVGAEPLAIVDCLNFGNPEQPDSYWQFVESVKGLGAFSHDFQIPIVGGNVSFYNETSVREQRDRINPTPTIGMLGVIEDPNKLIKNSFQRVGNLVFCIGSLDDNLNGSEFLRYNYGIVHGKLTPYDKKKEETSKLLVEKLNKLGLLVSCHDISTGGLIVSLAEMTFEKKIGVHLDIEKLLAENGLKKEEFFLSESSARYIVELDFKKLNKIVEVLDNFPHAFQIGKTISEPKIIIDSCTSFTIEELRTEWKNAIPKHIED
ncbi:MAG: AIR synthase related protein, partial [Candidatus Heimdallarchaeaceae archaeon]